MSGRDSCFGPRAWIVVLALHGAAPAQQATAAASLGHRDFSADSGVDGCNAVQIEFGPDRRLWVATTNGLISYDGYRWQHFGVECGLPSRFVRSLCFAGDGRLWLGTDAGAGWFDGRRFDAADTSGNLIGPSVRRIVEDRDGALWFCCDRWPNSGVTGGLSVRRADGWRSYTTKDGLPSDYVSDFVITSAGRRFALTSGGLAELRDDRFVLPLVEAGLSGTDVYIWSLVEGADGELIVAGDGLVCTCRDGAWQRRDASVPSGHSPRAVKLWRLAGGEIVGYASGREDRVLRFDGTAFESWSGPLPGTDAAVEDLVEASDGSIWVCGVGFLACWQPRAPEWSLFPGLDSPQLVDDRQRVWFAGARHSTFIEQGEFVTVQGLAGPLVRIRSALLGRSGTGLAAYSDGRLQPLALADLGLQAATHWVAGPEGWPWVAGRDHAGHATVVRRTADGWRTVCAFPDDFELVSLDCQSTERVVAILQRGEDNLAMLADPESSELLPLPASPRSMPHPGLLCDGDTLWLLGMQKLRRRTSSRSWEASGELPGDSILGAFRNGSGLWFTCEGTTGGSAGLARFDGARWHQVALPGTSVVGVDADGTRYLGSASPLLTVIPFDDAPRVVQLPMAERAHRVVRGPDGGLWIGTASGVLRWRPDGVPPETEVVDAPTGVGERDVIQLRVVGHRWWRPRRLAGSLQMTWRVDGSEWSPFEPLENSSLSVGPLAAGGHRIEVRLRDETGAIDPTPATVDVEVWATPLQQRWWFWVVVGVGLGALGLLGGATLRSAALRRAMSARLRAEERYSHAVRNSPLGILELDREGTIESINPAGISMLAYGDADAALGKPLGEVAVESDQGLLADAVARAARGQLAQLEFALPQDRYISAFLQPLRGAEDKVIRITVNLQDVTEQRQLEARLRHGQRMESIGQLAGGIAHDFNNLLTGVLGSVDILQRHLVDDRADSVAGSLLAEIDVAGRRAAELTRQLLAFARRERTAAGVFDVAACLREVEPLLRRIARGAVRVQTAICASAALVRLEPGHFERIVMNLAANAVEAMAGNGLLTVDLRHETLTATRETQFGVVPTGDYAVLRVKDTGSGIPPEVLPRIFEPFFTTKGSATATGLGLATVHGIVRGAGGYIDVVTRVRVGTEFSVWLPISKGGLGGQPADSASPPPNGSETVLACDDQAFVRRIVVRALRDHGYTVIEAAHAQEALTAAEQHAGPIDLLLTDLVMPGVGGRQLAALLAAKRPDTAVLFMTGYDGDELDLAGVLAKPFTAQELLERVRLVLDARQPTEVQAKPE